MEHLLCCDQVGSSTSLGAPMGNSLLTAHISRAFVCVPRPCIDRLTLSALCYVRPLRAIALQMPLRAHPPDRSPDPSGREPMD